MNSTRPQHGMRTFLVIWFGQLISLTGSNLTGFALGVWVFMRTGSATQFALISLFTTLPGIALAPIAGALVDRWDRRLAMIVSDSGAGLSTLIIALLLSAGRLEVWHIYILTAFSSTCSAFQWPAYTAATGVLVPKEHYGRASGLVQLAEAVAMIAGPAIAGALVGLIQVQGVILVDFATFLFALLTLAAVRIPRPVASAEGKAGQGGLLREAAYGGQYIVARPGLLCLLLFFAATNLVMGMVGVLFTPLVLSFATAAVLGTLMSIGGLGFLAGSLTMSAWGGPRRRVYGILGGAFLQGVMLFLAAAPPQVALLAVAIFVFFFGVPIINGCSQAIWLSKTPADVQGRVFATRLMIAQCATPLAYVLAGPLADHVFEPLMAEGGLLAPSIGPLLGVGPGRGIALLYVALGCVYFLAIAIALLQPRLRRVELELPDAVVQAAPAEG